MTTLRIYFSAQWHDASSDCAWALSDDAGSLLGSGHGPLAEMPHAKECIAIIGADRTLCSTIDPPSGPRRRWLKALPYLAEEHTLADPDENHVVPRDIAAEKQLMLFITGKAWLRRVIEACRAAGLPLRKAVPEVALPERSPDSWTLVMGAQSGFVCHTAEGGVALDAVAPQTFPVMLQLLLDSAQTQPKKIEVRFAHDLPQEQKVLPRWPEPTIAPTIGSDWDWRRAPIPASAPNLLWGELAPPARPLEYWPKLRPAVTLLALVLGIEMLGSNLQWALLAYERTSLSREMERSFRQAFGNDAALVNAPLQMQRNLADLRHSAGIQDDGDFLALATGASAILADLPANCVRELHYESGRLDVEIALPSVDAARGMQARLRGMGLNAQMEVKDTGNGATVRLSLRPGTAT